MAITVVNATNPFWSIVNNVLTIDHEYLPQTEAYSFFKECVEQNIMYVIDIDDNSYQYNNVTDLFYKTLSFYRKFKHNSREHLALEKAIVIIENIIQVEDVADELCMKMSM